ncbi:MAG TPA: FtsW/RodA/SpoVE family cell cycle protein [Fimbriimonadaceae bacterium]|jgi:rod shape determining protein RodA
MASLIQHRDSEKRFEVLRRFDPWLIGSALLLMIIGLLCLYSVDAANPSHSYFKKQLQHIGIGVIPFCIFFFVNPHFWRRYATVLYAANAALLALVLWKGRSVGGAQRWLQFGPIDFEPSELAKLLVVITLASFLLMRMDKIRSFSTFILSLLLVAVPLILVFKQPHLGSTLVILVAWVSICVSAGIRLRFLAGVLVATVLGLTFAMRVPGVLQPYQQRRVQALLSPNAQTNGYQPLRAQIAFGSGGLMGTGFLKGEQKQAHYIPEQENDFIFTVPGEEAGLFGCTVVLILYGVFFYRVWLLMVQSEDVYFKMLTAGIFGILAFHTFANLGMNLQLLPVVGLWLPFMSYGGTAIWLCMSCVALLLNMRNRQRYYIYGA